MDSRFMVFAGPAPENADVLRERLPWTVAEPGSSAVRRSTDPVQGSGYRRNRKPRHSPECPGRVCIGPGGSERNRERLPMQFQQLREKSIRLQAMACRARNRSEELLSAAVEARIRADEAMANGRQARDAAHEIRRMRADAAGRPSS